MPAPLTQTTGRRKEAVARVRLRDGEGKITINKRPLEDYFTSAVHRMMLTEPLRVIDAEEKYDVDAIITDLPQEAAEVLRENRELTDTEWFYRIFFDR